MGIRVLKYQPDEIMFVSPAIKLNGRHATSPVTLQQCQSDADHCLGCWFLDILWIKRHL